MRGGGQYPAFVAFRAHTEIFTDLCASSGPTRVEAAIETAAHTHPLMSLFVLERTRPYVIGLALVLVIAALALLGRATRPARPESVPANA